MTHVVLEKKTVEVNGKQMAYVEMGEGDPIVFQHGNPTQSYLWRNIMPHVADQGRCMRLDLIGMGDSDKLDDSGPDRYTFVEHYEYWSRALEALGRHHNVTFVIHDWGSALGFDWANQHRDAVAGICYMEAIVMPIPSWDEFPESARGGLPGVPLRGGREMVLENNVFVENVAARALSCATLDEDEMTEYRRPFAEPGEGDGRR